MEVIRMPRGYVNVHPLERWACLALGGSLAVSGLRRGWWGVPRILAGAVMIQRGVSGECPVYRALGVRTSLNTNNSAVPYELGIRARAAVTIDKPGSEVFAFWRSLENLPRFMRHLESVEWRGD